MLLSRIQNADSNKRSAPATKPIVFPYSLVETLLENHPLIQNLQVSAKQVHTALLQLHSHLSSLKESVKDIVTEKCFECNGDVEQDDKESTRVCKQCGLVQNRMSFNVSPEFVSCPTAAKASTNFVRGIPKYMLLPKRDSESKLLDMLQHWNILVGLSDEDVKLISTVLDSWKQNGISNNVKIAAALLYKPFRLKFPDECNTRMRLQNKQALETVKSVLPSPSFPCLQCGVLTFSKRSATYHCKEYGVKKRKL